VSFFANSELAARYRQGFPKSLNNAPMLLPTDHTAMRRSLNLWFDRKRIHPVVVGEFDDSATMISFGQEGAGVFPVPSVVGTRIQKERSVRLVGEADKVREQFYAITVEEKLKHPAVAAICEAARRELS
jgi:LysR family transcriptional activator of nhaA